MTFFVYVVASKRNGALSIGMTDDLLKCAWQHRHGIVAGFTRDYDVKNVVWYETRETRESGRIRERRMKKWNRAWKLELIEKGNPDWRDLSEDLPA
jgi:putative endonuclease